MEGQGNKPMPSVHLEERKTHPLQGEAGALEHATPPRKDNLTPQLHRRGQLSWTTYQTTGQGLPPNHLIEKCLPCHHHIQIMHKRFNFEGH